MWLYWLYCGYFDNIFNTLEIFWMLLQYFMLFIIKGDATRRRNLRLQRRERSRSACFRSDLAASSLWVDVKEDDDEEDVNDDEDDYDMGHGVGILWNVKLRLEKCTPSKTSCLHLLGNGDESKIYVFFPKVFFNWSRQFEIPILSRPRKDRGEIAAPFHDQIESSNLESPPEIWREPIFCHELILPLVIASFQKIVVILILPPSPSPLRSSIVSLALPSSHRSHWMKWV